MYATFPSRSRRPPEARRGADTGALSAVDNDGVTTGGLEGDPLEKQQWIREDMRAGQALAGRMHVSSRFSNEGLNRFAVDRPDAILQLDSSVGESLAALDRLGLTAHTLVVFTSDNGPVLDDGYRDDAVEKLEITGRRVHGAEGSTAASPPRLYPPSNSANQFWAARARSASPHR